MHGFDAEPFEPLDGTDDIQYRVDRADFVQMHLVGRDAVDASLRLAHEAERAYRALFDPIGDRRAFDQLDEVTDVTAVRLLRDVELHLPAGDAGPANIAHPHADVTDTKPCGQLLEPGYGNAQGEEGPQCHVAADAGGWIQDGYAHGPKSRNINGLGSVEPPGAGVK